MLQLFVSSLLFTLAFACPTTRANTKTQQYLPEDFHRKHIPNESPLQLSYRIGDKTIQLHVSNYPDKKSDSFFFNMHENERTSIAAGREMIKKMAVHSCCSGRMATAMFMSESMAGATGSIPIEFLP